MRIELNKTTYILSEKPGLSGIIAYEFLKKIVSFDSLLKFSCYGHGVTNNILESFLTDNTDVEILPSKNNERNFVIRNIIFNSPLTRLLCSLGNYPNDTIIENRKSSSPNDRFIWKIEYNDEIFTIIYNDNSIDFSKIEEIEKELNSKKIFFEQKKNAKVRYWMKN